MAPSVTRPARRSLRRASFLALIAVVSVGPALSAVAVAFMTPTQYARTGVGIPDPATLENFGEVFSEPAILLQPMLTTVGVAAVVALTQAATSLLAAYVFVRLRFPYRRTVFVVYVCAYLAPPVLTVLPVYIAFARLGLLGTFWALVLPFFLASPYAILLLRQAVAQIPSATLDAAELDGASHTRLLASVVFPLVRSTLAAVILLGMVTTWNSYFWPRLSAGVRLPQTQVALASLQTQYDSNWTLVMAGTCVVLLPGAILALLCSRVIRATIETTGDDG